MLAVKLLGQYDVRLDDQTVELHSRAAQLLLAYLLLNRDRQHTRESLAALLWPDSSPANARSNLRHALWRLRQALDTPQRSYITTGDELIGLDQTLPAWLDVERLEQPVPENAPPDANAQAVALYEGALLPGFDETWIVLERERLRALYGRQMCLLLRKLAGAGRWQGVIDWSERWIALGEVPEPAYRSLMRAHAAQGEISQVAAVYQRCLAALRDDLDVDPSPATQELYERLLEATRPPPRARLPEAPRTPVLPPAAAEVPAPEKLPTAGHAPGVWPAILFALATVVIALLASRGAVGAALPPLRAQPQLRYTVPGTGGVVLSPDGALVVTTDLGGAVVVRDAASGAPLHTLSGHTDQVIDAVFCPGGDLLVTASLDGTARLWAARSGRLLHVLGRPGSGLLAPACSADGTLIVTTGFDAMARLWDASSGRLQRVLVHQGTTSGPSFRPDGGVLAVADRAAVRLWNPATGHLIRNLVPQAVSPTAATFCPGGDRLLITGSSSAAEVWAPDGLAPLLTLRGHAGWITAGLYRADGQIIVTGSEDGTARLWNAESGTALLVIPGSSGGVGGLALSPDGTTLFVAGNDGQVRVWALPALDLERQRP